jgi:predicted TIM-barrel fold metal-dependent hydrolase
VSGKVVGGVASLNDKALDRILDFAGEVGLVVILHSDVDMPFPKPQQEPYLLAQMHALFARHPETTIIWAHGGLGRIVRPVKEHIALLERALADPALQHVSIDISWDETAKYITQNAETVAQAAAMINKYPQRFLFGSDVVAPTSIDAPMAVYTAYLPLWAALTPTASRQVRVENYQRLFDAARLKVRAWENANAGKSRPMVKRSPSSGTGTR